MYRGNYDYSIESRESLDEFLYHLEFGWNPVDEYTDITIWIQNELGLKLVEDFKYFFDYNVEYVLFIFKNEEHAAATKLRWIT